MLGTSPGEIRIMAANREIPAYRWGRKYRFFRDEVIAWLRDHTTAGDVAENGTPETAAT